MFDYHWRDDWAACAQKRWTEGRGEGSSAWPGEDESVESAESPRQRDDGQVVSQLGRPQRGSGDDVRGGLEGEPACKVRRRSGGGGSAARAPGDAEQGAAEQETGHGTAEQGAAEQSDDVQRAADVERMEHYARHWADDDVPPWPGEVVGETLWLDRFRS